MNARREKIRAAIRARAGAPFEALLSGRLGPKKCRLCGGLGHSWRGCPRRVPFCSLGCEGRGFLLVHSSLQPWEFIVGFQNRKYFARLCACQKGSQP